ncbi:MAG: glycosyltransferase family 2 protein [Candidatus Bathyarchaeota archaeon]|nr:glycosyltransferase family 2 protein [Candidatus Termiticorpusculum sp.]
MFEWQWTYWVVAIYGLVVTSFMVFRLISAYLYKPVPDRGYRPNVSIIIPVYNEESAIGNTIDAILNSNYPKDKMELVVVDDKSRDNSLEIINKKSLEYGFKVVAHTENMGKRHAMASGVKQCNGDILVCLDSDTLVEPDSIKMLVQPFTDDEVYCVCGNASVINKNSSKTNTWLTRFQKVWYAEAFRVRKGVESLFGMVLCCSGVFSAYRREKFERVTNEWLNEKFLGRQVVAGDDRQMTNLMMRMGGKSVFQSTALTYTVVPHNIKKFVNQQVRWARGSVRGTSLALTFFNRKNLSQKILFYLITFSTFVTPFVLVASIIGLALFGGTAGFISYFLGLVLVALLYAITDKLLMNYFTVKDALYRIALFALMWPVTFVYLYGWVTPWKGTVWGTR